MTVLEMLKRARALIAKPGTWCQGSSARAKDGLPVDEASEAAVRFCVFAAFARVYNEAYRALGYGPGYQTRYRALGDAYVRAKNTFMAMARKRFAASERLGIATFNDHPDRTHADVLATFDDAIQEAKVAP